VTAVPDDEPHLVARMVELDCQLGCFGYRRITALLRAEGFRVNHQRIERLWRREGLKVPQKQPRRRTALAERWLVRAVAARS
jgi:transposase InsO family protein